MGRFRKTANAATLVLVFSCSFANANTCESSTESTRSLTMVQGNHEFTVDAGEFEEPMPPPIREVDARQLGKPNVETPQGHMAMNRSDVLRAPPSISSTTSPSPRWHGYGISLVSKVWQQVEVHDVFVPVGVMFVLLLPFLVCMSFMAYSQPNESDDDSPAKTSHRNSSNSQKSAETPTRAFPAVPSSPLNPKDDARAECNGSCSSHVLEPLGEERVAWNGEPISSQLCPELVVPPEGECVLFVPEFTLEAEESHRSKITIDITHARNSAIFQASIEYVQEPYRLVLANAVGNTVFAYCTLLPQANTAATGDAYEISKKNGTPTCLSFCSISGKHFGDMISAAAPCKGSKYVFASERGWSLDFHIQNDNHSRRAFDDKGRLVALIERSPSARKTAKQAVTIGPCVDVGLILLGVLGMSLLEEIDRIQTSS